MKNLIILLMSMLLISCVDTPTDTSASKDKGKEGDALQKVFAFADSLSGNYKERLVLKDGTKLEVELQEIPVEKISAEKRKKIIDSVQVMSDDFVSLSSVNEGLETYYIYDDYMKNAFIKDHSTIESIVTLKYNSGFAKFLYSAKKANAYFIISYSDYNSDVFDIEKDKSTLDGTWDFKMISFINSPPDESTGTFNCDSIACLGEKFKLEDIKISAANKFVATATFKGVLNDKNATIVISPDNKNMSILVCDKSPVFDLCSFIQANRKYTN